MTNPEETPAPSTTADDVETPVAKPIGEELTPNVDQEVTLKDGVVAQTGVEEEGDGSDETPEKKEEEQSKKVHMTVSADAPWSDRMWEVFSTFWPLGLVAFGGPQVKKAAIAIVSLSPRKLTR